MVPIIIFSLFLISTALIPKASGDCDFMEEAAKIFGMVIDDMDPEKDQHEVRKGCFQAFLTGDSSKCKVDEFKFERIKDCEAVIHNPEFANKTAQFNVKKNMGLIEGAIKKNNGSLQEICQSLVPETTKLFAKLKELMEKPEEIKKLHEQFCGKKPEACQNGQIPDEAIDHFTADSSPPFKTLVKIGKLMLKTFGGLQSKGVEKVVSSMFGGGTFGEGVWKCVGGVIKEGYDHLGKLIQ